MTIAQTDEPPAKRPLRLWPGVAIVILQWLVTYGVPLIAPDAEVFSLPVGLLSALGGVLGGLAIVVWWMFFSRALWCERVGAIILMIVAVVATKLIVHESIAGAGMGMLLYISSIPYLSLALVAWALATRHLTDGARRVLLVAAIVLACAPWTLLRTAGIRFGGAEYHWRWTPTPEQRLLARANDEPLDAARGGPKALSPPPAPAETLKEPLAAKTGEPASLPAAPAKAKTEPAARAAEAPAEWPGFRGPNRDGIVRGVQIKTDWSASPPVELWRRPIGPGWSSFAVAGGLLYTQEQRGDDEIVACYRVATGKPAWRHRDAVRFWESNAGAGPRATPSL